MKIKTTETHSFPAFIAATVVDTFRSFATPFKIMLFLLAYVIASLIGEITDLLRTTSASSVISPDLIAAAKSNFLVAAKEEFINSIKWRHF
jgi:hypothetical protein